MYKREAQAWRSPTAEANKAQYSSPRRNSAERTEDDIMMRFSLSLYPQCSQGLGICALFSFGKSSPAIGTPSCCRTDCARIFSGSFLSLERRPPAAREHC